MAPQGPLQGISWGALQPPHPIAPGGHSTAAMPHGALAQLPLPWVSPGTALLFPRGPQHSSLCPWVSPGTAPCVLGESWHRSLCPMETWHSFLCLWLSTGTALFAPGGVLAQLPLTWGTAGTASSALKEP